MPRGARAAPTDCGNRPLARSGACMGLGERLHETAPAAAAKRAAFCSFGTCVKGRRGPRAPQPLPATARLGQDDRRYLRGNCLAGS